MTTCNSYIYKEDTSYKVAFKVYYEKKSDVLDYNTDTKNAEFKDLLGANKAEMKMDMKILKVERDDTAEDKTA